jgi:hypothetical protein
MQLQEEGVMKSRVLFLLGISAVLLTGCGSSGGDDEPDDVEAPLVILNNYNFFLGNLNNGELLTADVGGEFTVTIDIDGLLAGNLDLDVGADNTVTFLSYLLRAGNSIDLTVTSPEGSPLDGTFRVSIGPDIEAAVGELPTSGTIVIDYPDTVFPVEVIILADGVQLNSLTGMFQYTWEEFAALLDGGAGDDWQAQASLAFGVIEFLTEQFFNVADVLDDLELVTLNNPYVEACDMFTGSPPQGVLAQGELTITWLGSGELSDGDDFTWVFEDCWSQDDNELLDGTVTLEDYTESVDFNTGVLFNIGFGGLGAGAPGGVIFDLTFAETVEDQGVWTISVDGVIAVSGGFVLNIQQP